MFLSVLIAHRKSKKDEDKEKENENENEEETGEEKEEIAPRLVEGSFLIRPSSYR